MSYLSRDDAPFSQALWREIDGAVVTAAKDALVGRRFLSLYGPLGIGACGTVIDGLGKQEVFENGIAIMEGRSTVQFPIVYEDFWLYGRDIAASEQENRPVDLSAASYAAQNLARREDTMVFYGIDALGVPGLLNAKGVASIQKSDWDSGEGAFKDVAAAVAALMQNGRYGRHTLVVSLDMFVQMQRIQPGTGVLEYDRIKSLLGGRVYSSSALKPGTAALLCAQPQYMDLAVGQDIATAYTEAVDLNHHLRVMETALVRLKAADAVVLIK